MANSRKKSALGLWLVSTTAALLGGMGAAGAQSTQGASAAAPQENEVVITAERRTQSLHSVPIAATVLNADMLQKHGVNNIADVQQAAPSLAINTFNRSTFINIRGVGLAQSTPTDVPGVATYLDGVLMPHEQMIAQSFYDLNSIEVLRGPQGTLSGQNSTGGAVYITTPAPMFGVYGGYIDQTFGNYGGRKTIGALNVPLGKFAAVRFAAVVDQRDSFTTNIAANAKAQPGNVNLLGYRMNAAIKPTDALKINLRYEHFSNSTFNNAIKNRADAVTKDPFTIEEDANGYFQQHGYRTSVEALYDLPNAMRVRWLTSYEYAQTEDLSDADRTATLPSNGAATGGRVTYAHTGFNTLINEINLLSTGDGPVDWVVGAFNQQEEVPVTLARDYNHTVDFVKFPFLSAGANNYSETKAGNDSASVFGQLGWKLAPQWKAILGARYSADKQVYQQQFFTPVAGKFIGTERSHALTGRAALNWTPDEDAMYYVSFAKGYKAGGVNLNPAPSNPNLPNFAPEQNYVGELGAKHWLWDKRLSLDAAVFYATPKDVQFNSVNAAGNPIVENVGKEKSYGAELEALGHFNDWRTNVGISYLHSEFNGDACLTNPVPTNPAYPVCVGTAQIAKSGTTPPFAPEWTINGGVDYTFHLGNDMTLIPRLQGSYLSKQYATAFAGPDVVVPSHEVFDARLTFEPNDIVQIEGFVTNLSDKTYIASQVQDASAKGGIIYGAPRQYGVRLRAKF